MSKEYTNRNLRPGDLDKVLKLILDADPLIATPSTIPNIYDAEYLRQAIGSGRGDVRALLDNNIVTQILPFVDDRAENRKHVLPEERVVAAIVCSLIYSGIELNPAFAFYEADLPDWFPSKEELDVLFRIADHVHPQYFCDIATGLSDVIPSKELKRAKQAVYGNPLTMKDVKRTSYSGESLPIYKLSVQNMLKAWMVNKSCEGSIERLRKHLEWMYVHSLSSDTLNTFLISFLSDSKPNNILKKTNSTDELSVVRAIDNAAWDILYIDSLIRIHNSSKGKIIWFLVTRDKKLKNLARVVLSLNSSEAMERYVKSLYPSEAIQVVDDYQNKVKSRLSSENHVSNVTSNLDKDIDQLRIELGLLLAI